LTFQVSEGPRKHGTRRTTKGGTTPIHSCAA
jgi:hypothetical protein